MESEDIKYIVEKVIQELSEQEVINNEDAVILKEERQSSDVILFSEERGVGIDNPNNIETIERAQSISPARIGIGRAGTRMKTKNYLQFRIAHAAAQDAVLKDVSDELIKELDIPVLQTKAADMETYLKNLDYGRKLNDESIAWLEQHGDKNVDVQILICDGLSSTAVESNIRDILPALLQGLKQKDVTIGQPLFVKRSRVWVQDHVAAITKCKLVVSLIGERPGLNTDKSLSAYMVYSPSEQTVEADRTVISNVHRDGMAPVEAGAYLADLIATAVENKCTGIELSKILNR